MLYYKPYMNNHLITPLTRSKLSECVFVQLCDLISKGRFNDGDRLPSEKELSNMFQVSRTTIRTGLQGLTALGMIEPRSGNGTFVTKRSAQQVGEIVGAALFHGIEDLEEIYEGRRVVESWTAYLAATRITEGELDRLEQLVDKQSNAVDHGKTGIDADFQFHLQIGVAARNEVVLRLWYSLVTLIFKVLDPSKRTKRDLTLAVDQHRDVLKSLKERDALSAMTKMWEHVVSGTKLHEGNTSFPSAGVAATEKGGTIDLFMPKNREKTK
jgi:GntR family transcriptional repressor for pyruvate dehydrogenase complex